MLLGQRLRLRLSHTLPAFSSTQIRLRSASTKQAISMTETVQLHVAGKTPEALADFKARFEPADTFKCQISCGEDPGNPASAFDSAAYMEALSTSSMGHVLLSTPAITSTQEFMRAHARVLPPGSVMVAESQTSGRGRGGNQWTSPPGCLMFTASRNVKVPGSQAPFINYVVCLAVVQGIKKLAAQHLQGSDPGVRIKWPNDIYVGSQKIGGALIHTSWQSDAFNTLTGIGVNVSNRQPTTCLEEVIDAALAAKGQEVTVTLRRELLLASIINALEHCFETFESEGFAPLQQQYLSAWLHSNQQVELAEGAAANSQPATSGAGGAERRMQLTIIGLTEHGFLLAVDAYGGRYELTPDGNSLDMMQGLIRRKLPA